ncbi:glycosyltransferase family 1 protein [Nitrosomonas ureae]|uniref:Uncharacterized protein n=1 Tax=Nitrosomonas ureae TaxID=44577 RepID=A0A0S3AMH3_9PROT|nr:glycosyltransferase family 1 protein [Nitrosomonas ureae]ALQ52104.1 hypothetical protein ATY38_13300 [Nitrosomonas ureae]PXX17633.1 hypothetical protein C8R27_10344 [Nitrosomonas ureae]SDU04085.1 hypothetical protein SAMN05216406_11916 [Nitrosomonas ureae]
MTQAQLTFYDTSRAYYASYYLQGFDELSRNGKLQIRVAHSLPERLKPAIQDTDWEHLLFAMALFKFQQGNHEWYFCIDTHDVNSVNVANHTGGYHLPLLQGVDVYFKVNHNPDQIEYTPILKDFRKKILSVSQFFPIKPGSFLSLSRRLLLTPRLFGFRPGVNYNVPYKDYLTDAKFRLRDLKNFQSLEQILAHRTTAKDIDIFFVTSFRQNARHAAVMNHRYQVIKKLSSITSLNMATGFSSEKALPEEYAKVFYPRLNQENYLETLARAKVVIYTQGIAGCLSSKFGLAMALGVAVIGEPLGNNPDLLIANPHLKEQFSYSNPDDIVAHAVHLATNPEQARRLGALNAAMFDNQLAPRPTAEYILQALQKFQF